MPEQLQTSATRTAGDRPFPWRCPKCLQKTVYPVVMPYRAQASHDSQLYRFDLPDLRVPKCSNCGELVFGNDADQQITQALRAHLRLLTPEQMAASRCKLGLHRADLAERLGVAEEVVDGWESGLVVQSRAMDNLLRLYFALPNVRAVLTGANQDPGLGVTVGLASR